MQNLKSLLLACTVCTSLGAMTSNACSRDPYASEPAPSLGPDGSQSVLAPGSVNPCEPDLFEVTTELEGEHQFEAETLSELADEFIELSQGEPVLQHFNEASYPSDAAFRVEEAALRSFWAVMSKFAEDLGHSGLLSFAGDVIVSGGQHEHFADRYDYRINQVMNLCQRDNCDADVLIDVSFFFPESYSSELKSASNETVWQFSAPKAWVAVHKVYVATNLSTFVLDTEFLRTGGGGESVPNEEGSFTAPESAGGLELEQSLIVENLSFNMAVSSAGNALEGEVAGSELNGSYAMLILKQTTDRLANVLANTQRWSIEGFSYTRGSDDVIEIEFLKDSFFALMAVNDVDFEEADIDFKNRGIVEIITGDPGGGAGSSSSSSSASTTSSSSSSTSSSSGSVTDGEAKGWGGASGFGVFWMLLTLSMGVLFRRC